MQSIKLSVTNTLASRSALLTGSIAALAVLISGLAAYPLIRHSAEAQVRASLSSQADLVRDVATNPNDFDTDHLGRPDMQHGQDMGNPARTLLGLVGYLRVQGVEVQAIMPGTHVPSTLTVEQVSQVVAGSSVSAKSCERRTCVFVEARPVGVGTGIVLIQSASVASNVSGKAIGRIFIALIAGFIVAVLVGLAAARRLTKPLADAANAAHRLAAGERDVRLVPEGPTEISEIAEALNSLAEELERSEGRQREFLTSVSHELRTPLTAIRGYAEGMSDGIVTGSEMVHVGQIIESESVRLDRLVNDLLDLARTGAVDFPLAQEDVDLVQVLSQAGDVWAARTARENVKFSSVLPDQPVVVRSDAMRIRQIIDNLAENALRVTPEGEHIVFALDPHGAIEVRDSGPGLTQDDEAVAFQPGELFERYRGVRKVGTGFGLALVGRLAIRLGATASVTKAPEGGASFRIDFGNVRLQ
jgi:two-component system sensor histidine kinase BaeS